MKRALIKYFIYRSLPEQIIKRNERYNTLLDIAAKRRRNYIIEDNNLIIARQNNRLHLFPGFARKFIVIVPTDDDYKKRRYADATDEFNDPAPLTMRLYKKNFSFPSGSSLFRLVSGKFRQI